MAQFLQRMEQMEQLVNEKNTELEKITDNLMEERQNQRLQDISRTAQGYNREATAQPTLGDKPAATPESSGMAARKAEERLDESNDVDMSEEDVRKQVVGEERVASGKEKARYVHVSDDDDMGEVVENNYGVSFNLD
jgi:hypothetical protein